ncbi:MAG: radical SAM protein [Candidatus Pacearchaeota archaeon]|jgi:MoaA/NifB/PqqE/SkfB family radical SAM enzyme
MGVYQSLKEKAEAKLVKKILLSLSNLSNENMIRIANVFEKFTSDKTTISAIEQVKKLIKEDHPAVKFMRRIVQDMDPNCRDKFIENLLIRGLIQRQKVRQEVEESGSCAPFSILISPSMRCNLKCIGCYAGKYDMKDDLGIETFDSIITQGEKMGTALFTILGGEPLVIKDQLFAMCKKHNKSFFQFYSNGTLMTEEVVKQIRDLGNIIPVISVEGYKKETDARRGKGVYDNAMKVMDLLKRYRVPFGYSVVVTSKNADLISSDEYVDFMISKGAFVAWHFLYMPVGEDPNLKLMPTPKQRLMLLDRWKHVRNTKQIFIVDFWNDAPYVGGCIAGKHYVHITSKGDVEPCIFTHMAVDNIKNKPLIEIMKSDFFKELRKRQPFNENHYMPCMWIDNPKEARDIFSMFNCHTTHPGGDVIIKDKKIMKGMDKYSKEVKKLYDPVWKKDFPEKANKSKK